MIERTTINSYITKSNTKKGGAYAPYATCMATPLLRNPNALDALVTREQVRYT